MSENQEIPCGWEVVKIGDIFDFIGGGTPSKKNESYWHGDINWASVKDVKGDYLTKTIDTITKEGLKNSAANLAHPKDVILITRIIPGRTIISQIVSAINQDLKIIKPRFDASPEFIRYLFSFIERDCIKLASGTTVLGISLNNLNEILIPLPPVPEQHRIVAKIEELFSSLDKGIENLKTAQQQLKVYRQAVLKWAFEGKLTNKNVLDGELPKGWTRARLEEIILTLDQGWSPKCENKSSNNINQWAVIKTTAVQSGSFIETENKILPKNLEPRKQHELRVEDILITRAGPRVRVGVCCMIKHVRPKLINCDKVYRIKVKDWEVISAYFAMILNSPDYSAEIEKMKTGISDSGVNLTQKGFLQISIKLPPIEEQRTIVSEIESRLSVCDKIEEGIEHSLRKAESLRQSILKKAFEGKLVPQDPNDEPASVLLERIRADRNNQAAEQRNVNSKRKEKK
jgi:type I restriction enzyme, S subunit